MNQNTKGIERLYRLIGSDQRFDYDYYRIFIGLSVPHIF